MCTSIMYKDLRCGKWICKCFTEFRTSEQSLNPFNFVFRIALVLVDSTSRDITVDAKRSVIQHHKGLVMRQVPRRIRVEDFREIPLYSAYQPSQHNSDQTSLFNSISSLLKTQSDDIHSPNLFQMAYYPIRLMMAEWLRYTALMAGYVKFYEYTFESMNQRQKEAENQDFKELHRRRRSSKESLRKLHSVENFVLHRQAKDPTCEKAKHVLQDIRYIVTQIEDHKNSPESMVAIMTSVIQLTDSRRSIEEAFNIRG